jgi:hypothetical protein
MPIPPATFTTKSAQSGPAKYVDQCPVLGRADMKRTFRHVAL